MNLNQIADQGIQDDLDAEAKRLAPMPLTSIIAIDDWWIYATGPEGNIVHTSAECWSEWLYWETAPEDLSDREFKKAVLSTLLHKTDVRWSDYRSWIISSEEAYAKAHGHVFTLDDLEHARQVAAEYLAEVRQLGIDQALLLITLQEEMGLA
jgi:hypothetical protein